MRALNRSGTSPLHVQLERQLRDEISTGRRRIGDRIESVRALSRAYGISSFTVQRALTTLAQEGLLRGERGRGVFVAAQEPRTGKGFRRGTLGFISSYSPGTMASTPFFARLSQGLLRAAASAGRDLLCIAPTVEGPRPRPVAAGELQGREVAGFLVLAYDVPYLLSLRALRVPWVCLDYDLTYAGTDSVVFGNEQAGYDLTCALAADGARRIVYVGFGRRRADGAYEVADPSVWERYSGVRRAVSELSLPQFEQQYLHMDLVPAQESARIARTLAALSPAPDAVVVFDANVAHRLGAELGKAGIPIPARVRLAGFGAAADPAETRRWLSYQAHVDEDRMAREGIETLLRRIAVPDRETVRQVIPMSIGRPA